MKRLLQTWFQAKTNTSFKIHMIAFLLLCISFNVSSQNIDSSILQLEGKWNWTYSSGGFSGGTISPSSLGYNKSIIFHQEANDIGSDSTSYQSFKNDTLIYSGKVKITPYPTCLTFGLSPNNLLINGGFDANSFIVNDSLLTISDCYNDGYSHQYQKDITYLNISKEEIDNGVSIFPNPTKDFIDITFEKYKTIDQIELLNIRGQTFNYNANEAFSKYRIALIDLESGVYILRIVTDNKIVIAKIMKE